MGSTEISAPIPGSPDLQIDAPRMAQPPSTPATPGPTTYLIRLTQAHEDFRLAELHALSEIERVPFTILSYTPTTPILLITGPPTPAAATRLARRAILTQAIYEHWGTGATLEALHASVKSTSSHLWAAHSTAPWRFTVDAFQGGAANGTHAQRTKLINTFRYLPLHGPISLKAPQLDLTIFELYAPGQPHTPVEYHLARRLGPGAATMPAAYDVKKRPYISTTSMAADLALVTANIALAAPGKLFYDPFVGTGSFPLACAAFGAVSWGSDIDGRAVRGDGADARAEHMRGKVKGTKTLRGNFVFYGTEDRLGDVFAGDLTHSPLRRCAFGEGGEGGRRRLFDGIVGDPPYGVREGLRVLGCRDPEGMPWVVEAGHARYKDPSFIPPKKPYSFDAMLSDILHFASQTLVDNGRLAFWMPTANEATPDLEHPIPSHPCLALAAHCVQPFNRWSRRLLTYRKLPDAQVAAADVQAWEAAREVLVQEAMGADGNVKKADELNAFRKSYFSGFVKEAPPGGTTPPQEGEV